MKLRSLFKSVATACLIAVAVHCVTIGMISVNLPRVVGRPDISMERSLRLPAAKMLWLSNHDGTVRIRTREMDEILLSASIKAYAQSTSNRAEVERYVESLIDVNSETDTLRIATEPGERPDLLDLRVDYSIVVPVGTDVSVEGSNGNVWVSKGCGQVSVRGRNTDIEVVEPAGSVFAESTNGRIRVVDAPQGATIRTVNGNVYAHMLGGRLEAATTNGAIVAHVLEPEVSACDLTSQNGGITLVMSGGCSARVDAVTGRGVVKSDFPVDSSSGIQQRRQLRGTIGRGDTILRMDTLNGNIWIARSKQ
ncbi:MAG: hypothetical protein GWP08_19560 [Nitrospiraceae bacterium]|nr:hypothetical protein [Nitrospiraceae bacterium]